MITYVFTHTKLLNLSMLTQFLINVLPDERLVLQSENGAPKARNNYALQRNYQNDPVHPSQT